MTVGRICQREVDLAREDETVQAVSRRMLQRGVGTLVLLNEAEKPVGIVTDRDLVLRVLAANQDLSRVKVGDIMTACPRTVTEGTSIEEALAVMRRDVVRRLPVVGDDGKLVGLVSVDDVLVLLAEELSNIGLLLERETPAASAQRETPPR